MVAKCDYTKLTAAILQHAKDADGVFTVLDLNEIADEFNVERHTIRNALAMMVREESIVKVGKTARPHGGGTHATTYKYNSDYIPKPSKKTAREQQMDTAQRLQAMNTAALRLSKALGIPCHA